MEPNYRAGCYIRACWTAREETPEALAQKFASLIDRLRQIDPVFELWTGGAKRPKKFETLRANLVDDVKASISTDDFGEPLPIDGYWFGAVTRGQPPSRSFAINVHAGAHKPTTESQNDLFFENSSMAIPEHCAVSYRIFKSALAAIIDFWKPDDCIVMPRSLMELIDLDRHFRDPWMQYLSKPFADLITPPKDVLTERSADGGLLMIATTETFNVGNPAHVAAAHAIGASTAVLERLPYVYHRPTR